MTSHNMILYYNFYETLRVATSEYNFQIYKNSLTKSTKTRLKEDKTKDKKL